MSAHPTLTRQQAEALLTEVAAEYPDRVVDSCCYVVDDEPSCLVGHVLHRAGWSIADLRDADTANFGNSAAVDDLSRHLGAFAGLAPGAGQLLHVAQDWQDNDAPWAEAVTAALGGAA